jgi:D-serine deaminase-like pyridoxal phosphate-dependent protein
MVHSKIPYPMIDTSAVLINLDILEANIRRTCDLAAKAGVRLRPHTKIHECPQIARMQIKAGACGIEVGTVDRAKCMIDGGITDVLVAHPFYGEHKLETFKQLVTRPGVKISVLVDMFEQAASISRLAVALGRQIPTLIKINTGGNRFGIQPGESAVNFAKEIDRLPGLKLTGIYAHEMGGKPTPEGVDQLAFEVASRMVETARLMRAEGLTIEHVSVGSSPTFAATCRYLQDGKFPEITEIHPGHCSIGDIWHVYALGNAREACAATILTTVMSTPAPGYVVIDAGYKTFGADPLMQYQNLPNFFWKGRPSYGSVQGRYGWDALQPKPHVSFTWTTLFQPKGGLTSGIGWRSCPTMQHWSSGCRRRFTG